MQRFWILLVLLLAGCDVSDRLDYQLPATGDRFDAAPDQAPASWPDQGWWRLFGSAELDRLIQSGTAANQDLRAAIQRVAQSDAAYRATRAALFPSLDLSVGAGRSRSPSSSDLGQSRTRNSYSAQLQASYELDLAGELRSAAAAGEASLLASRYDRDAVALQLTADTADAYFTLLAVRDRLRLARDALDSAKRVLDLVRVQARAGGVSDLEVQQQLSAVTSQEASVASIEADEQQSRNALAVLVGLRPAALAVDRATLDGLVLPEIKAGLPSELLRRRPDLARAEADLVAAGFDAQAARAARFPAATLTASTGLQSSELSDFLSTDRAAWSLAASILAPIFDAGRLEAGEDQAVARQQELAATYAQAILTALQDVEDSLVTADLSRRTYALRRAAYDAAQQAYRISELRWRTGAAGFLSVLQAQQTTFTAADLLAQADLARYTGIVSLYRALGGGWAVGGGAAGG